MQTRPRQYRRVVALFHPVSIEARYLSGLLLWLFSLEVSTNGPKRREYLSNKSQLRVSSDGLSWTKLVSTSRWRIQFSITSLYTISFIKSPTFQTHEKVSSSRKCYAFQVDAVTVLGAAALALLLVGGPLQGLINSDGNSNNQLTGRTRDRVAVFGSVYWRLRIRTANRNPDFLSRVTGPWSCWDSFISLEP